MNKKPWAYVGTGLMVLGTLIGGALASCGTCVLAPSVICNMVELVRRTQGNRTTVQAGSRGLGDRDLLAWCTGSSTKLVNIGSRQASLNSKIDRCPISHAPIASSCFQLRISSPSLRLTICKVLRLLLLKTGEWNESVWRAPKTPIVFPCCHCVYIY